MKTHQKSDPKWEPKSIKNNSQIDAKKETKKECLKSKNFKVGGRGGIPKPNHFKRHCTHTNSH
jgi:hypothetical protein